MSIMVRKAFFYCFTTINKIIKKPTFVATSIWFSYIIPANISHNLGFRKLKWSEIFVILKSYDWSLLSYFDFFLLASILVIPLSSLKFYLNQKYKTAAIFSLFGLVMARLYAHSGGFEIDVPLTSNYIAVFITCHIFILVVEIYTKVHNLDARLSKIEERIAQGSR